MCQNLILFAFFPVNNCFRFVETRNGKSKYVRRHMAKKIGTSNMCTLSLFFAKYLSFFETGHLFSTNVPLMDKPGSWFLLAKWLKNTCGRVTF